MAGVEYYHDSAYWEEKSSTGKLPASWQWHWAITDCHTGKGVFQDSAEICRLQGLTAHQELISASKVCVDFWAEHDWRNEAYETTLNIPAVN